MKEIIKLVLVATFILVFAPIVIFIAIVVGTVDIAEWLYESL